ncbi:MULTISPECIES: carbohydrate ABC transporter permease [Cohnella]|uniref:Putative aldouronate transport system permease protein n=1 Tax=Cohnella phaseoli TaxID=456490 RepID=A0A3D9JT12_9BACL|nr:carbohydrate ABC transporter permease [Cohnella phaseoli]RED76919.1 putative aldouronate transport system permease protein [Cohnella phaseoli]
MRKAGSTNIAFDVFNYLLMAVVVMLTFYPFVYMVMLSLSSENTYAKALFYPEGLSMDAYRFLVTEVDFFSGLSISIARSTVGPLCTIAVIYMGAYALSRKELVFRKFFTRYVIFAMYFTAGILPVYMNISGLHLTGTFWVYILPNLVSVFGLILIRTFIQELPRSLEESAFIDGANDLQVAFRIIFPLCVPVLAAMLLFEFIFQWNSFTDTLLYNTTRSDLFTLQYILTNYVKNEALSATVDISDMNRTGGSYSLESIKMAMTVIVCIPIIIVYPFLQRYFIQGLLLGAVKE